MPNHHQERTRIANSLGFLHRGPISPRAHGPLDCLVAAALILARVDVVECLLGRAEVRGVGEVPGDLGAREVDDEDAGEAGTPSVGISEITVKADRGQVMRNMQVQPLAELVRLAGALDVPLVTHI